MTLGTILAASFQTLRRNPAATLAPALILSVLVAVIEVVGSASFLSTYFGTLSDVSTGNGTITDGQLSSVTSSFVGVLITSSVTSLLRLIITAIISAIVTLQVASSALGSRLRLASLWRRLRGRRGAVVGWAALTGAALVITFGLFFVALIGIGSTGSVGVGIALLLGFLVGSGLFVVFVWLWVKLGFVPAVLVVERATIRQSMRRSWHLTNGSFWRTFGIRLLVLVIVGVATSIITAPISFLFTIGSTVTQPNGSPESALTGTLLVSTIVTQGVTAVISAVGLVVSTATTALLYLDQRMRLEGLDLDLTRFVERRATGEQGLRDPYLVAEQPPSAAPAAAPSGFA
jgi:membrane-anchored glycerophosphoryl diester phosphodiesterase (GDPDase)